MLDVRATPAGSAAGAVAASAPPAASAVLPLPHVEDPAGPAEWRTAGGRLARDAAQARMTLDVARLSGHRLSAFSEGLVLGAYHYSQAGTAPTALRRVDLRGADEAALAHGLRHAAATVWARDLANTPAATKTPAWLASTAARELSRHGVQVEVHDEQWLRDNGFGGVLAVGAGSMHPPRLLVASWRPRRARAGVHAVIVGKGVTYDTGGINLKPGTAMSMMQTDMAGGAGAVAALRAVAQAGLAIRTTVVMPIAENSLSGSAMRPGDVVRHYGGRTTEVANTDAEGRLLLADAMAYAVARLRPSVLVDIATLTGAMKVTLGLRTAGLFATDDRLARQLSRAADVTGEAVWRLPLPVEYEVTLHSDLADATNAPGNPGGIGAALYLRTFAGGVPWAHLDIAGPGRAPRADGMLAKGATGFGARLLTAWLESLA